MESMTANYTALAKQTGFPVFFPRQSLTVNIHCEFSSRFHSDSKWIRSGFESKRRESPRIHNVFVQQYGFANFGRVFTVIHCETLSWVPEMESDSCCQGEKRLRAHDTFLHLIDLFVGSNRLHQWPQMRKLKDNQIVYGSFSSISATPAITLRLRSTSKAVSLPCFFPEAIRS